MRFSIFSHTPNKHSDNSAVLHRADFDGDEEGRVAEIVEQELKHKGHQIVDCMRGGSPEESQARERRHR